MSQKKVDAYKESKKNRKEEVQKEKRAKKIRAIVGWAILVAVIAGLIVGLVFTFKNCTTQTDDGYTVTEQVIVDLVDIEGTGTESESEEPTEDEESEEETEDETEEASEEATEEASEEETEAESEESKAE